jgi:hypothetical protein
MSTNEKREILELLETGQIDAEEAARMLSGVSSGKPANTPVEEPAEGAVESPETAKGNGKPSMFRVRVRRLDTGENKVSVNIPLRMLKLGLRLGGRFSPHLEGINMAELKEMMTDMESGMLVEVQDEESNEHVQVYLD